MIARLTFTLTLLSLQLFSQSDSSTTKRFVDHWHEVNERHDTVERPDPAIETRRKDSLRKIEFREFNFSQGRWGLIYIKEKFLAEQTEITIGEWLNYIYYSDLKHPIINSGKVIPDSIRKQILNTQIDSTLLPSKEFLSIGNNKSLFTNCKNCDLLRIHALDGFAFIPLDAELLKSSKKKKDLEDQLQLPVAGISYEQAVAFCKWRTTLDSLRWLPEIDSTGTITGRIDYDYAYIYRLPTETEFNLMNAELDSLTTTGFSNFNYKNANQAAQVKNNTDQHATNNYTRRLNAPRKNKLLIGVYNVQGNVAEMTSTKGIAKGGSYFHYALESYGNKNILYDRPQVWLGFRCVAVPRVE